MTAPHVYSYRPSACIKVTGEDGFIFLQGQFTNELRQVEHSVAYGLWLNQKGRVLADSYVLRGAEREFMVLSMESVAEIIVRRLEDYIVADDVTLADTSENVFGLAVWGAGCRERVEAVFGVLPASGQFLPRDRLSVFAGRRSIGVNYEFIGPEEPVAELYDRFRRDGFAAANESDAELVRISDGIPAVPHDVGPGDLPNEGGLEDSTISYTKGCYLGQEVMARLRTRGQVRRRLRVIRGPGPLPLAQAPLYQGGKRVGEVRSVARNGEGFIAMAMLTNLGFDETAGIGLSADGEMVARVQAHG